MDYLGPHSQVSQVGSDLEHLGLGATDTDDHPQGDKWRSNATVRAGSAARTTPASVSYA